METTSSMFLLALLLIYNFSVAYTVFGQVGEYFDGFVVRYEHQFIIFIILSISAILGYCIHGIKDK